MIFENKKRTFLFLVLITIVFLSTFGFTKPAEVSEEINIADNFSGKLDPEFISRLNAEHSFTSPPDTNDIQARLDSLRADSIKKGLIEIDPTKIDSTARIKNFKYVRKDNRFLTFDPERKKSFYAYPSQQYIRRTVELDSTGKYVIIRELIANNEIRYPLKIPLEDYIKLKMESVKRGSWEKLGYKYTLKSSKDDLGQLLSDITNIEIPLPSVSFLSIFGPPKINLRINGAVDIRGAWRNETTEGVTASLLGNTRNEPDFKQQVQINVNGTIGDKLTISADWNTERTFEYENQLKLHYKGYDDEIIQSVEAGNVSLQTSPLVGGGEALFGIKALFQFGPFTLTALASQKKSEVEEVSVSGGSQKNEFEIHAYDYSQNHYFVDLAYADTSNLNLFERYYGNANPDFVKEYHIKELEVWKTTSAKVNIGEERKGNAFINLPPRQLVELNQTYDDSYRNINVDAIPGRNVINDRFVPMVEGVDYTYNSDAGFISFRTQINDQDAIGIAYRVEGPEGDVDDYYGEFLREVSNDTSTVIVLKLIKPRNLKPGGDFDDAWRLQLKNIYSVGGRDVKKEGFKLDIVYQIAGQEPVNTIEGENIIEKFGLDKTDESGTGGPDGAFDWDIGRTILTSTGEIIFPVLQPFGVDFPFDKELSFQAVYDTSVTFAKQDKLHDKFVIVGEYSADASSVYNIGFNVVENSVKVLLNGAVLVVGKDYSVDYNIGQVIIRNEDALVPGANLKITYEKNDLFQLASKTLLGLRGIYDFSKKTKLGFSYLNLNQTTLSDKVRIGEEPLSNSIFGLDFQTGFDMPFITKGLNNIISTKVMSSFNLKGEFAYMSPDPNTKKSKIASDKKESIAYVDDFEGAKRTIPIGVTYGGWRDISVPDRIPGHENDDLSKQELMSFKAKSYWFNFIPSDVKPEHIWGNRKSTSTRNNQVTVLDYVYDPGARGTYNYTPSLENKEKNWGGIMRPLSSTATNLVEENIEFIEFWLNIPYAPEDTKLIFDLGQISEDIIPNNKFDSEDLYPYNEILDEGEDVGLDGLTNAEEIAIYGDIDGTGDPSNDDFRFTLKSNMTIEDYSTLNGTEGNGTLSERGRLPDSEDMRTNNYGVDKVNSYFRYEVPIDTSRQRNKFISGGGDNAGWYQFRIPLKEFTDKIGNPSLTQVEVVRMWVTGIKEPMRLRFAELNLVGNQWQKVIVPGRVEEGDTTLVVSTINFEDNPEYSSPPGVVRERDRTNTEELIYKNEQSLQLVITDLEDGDSREIVKYLYRPLDVFNYKEMKLFIHGDLNDNPGSISYYVNDNDYGAEVFFRFGTDTSNFYEYRQPVKRDWNEIAIVFEELTAIKQRRTDVTELFSIPVPGKDGHFYGVKGNPTLTKVNYFSFGILNPNQETTDEEIVFRPLTGEPVSGELWVNELRVLGADDTPGWAYSTSAQFKFADLMSVNVNAGRTDPYFHKLNQRFGSRVDNNKWGASINFDVIKLLPWNLTGSNFNINYSRSESVSKPLYMPGTDVNVDEAVKQEKQKLLENGVTEKEADNLANKIRTNSQTVNISDTWSLSSIKFKLPQKSWYVQDIINNLQFAFSYNKTFSRNPSVRYSNSWLWNGSGKYSLNFSRNNYFLLSDIPLIGGLFKVIEDYKNAKFYFTPQTFSTGISASRKNAVSLSSTDSALAKTQRDFTAKRNFGFNWKITEGGLINLSLSYNVNVASSYAHLLAIDDVNRSEREIWNDILNGQFFGKDYNYSQNFDIKTKPSLPNFWKLKRYLTFTMGYSANYNWSNNFRQEDLGRSAKFSNSIRAGLTLKLKSLTAPLFAEKKETKLTSAKKKKKSRGGRGRGRSAVKNIDEERDKIKDIENAKKLGLSDTLKTSDSTDVIKKDPIYLKALNLLKMASKWLFFDYENINMNFSQSNSVSGSGLKSEGTGFSNFWGIETVDNYGPSRSFMLGLSSDLGARAPNGSLSDNFSQKNTVDFKTSRPLWEGAKISLNWKVSWSYNKTTRFTTDQDGNIFVTDLTANGGIDRSFIHLPIFFSNTGIAEVNKIYKDDPDKDLSKAFTEGFESIPILSGLPIFSDLSKFIPRANWRLDWRGLEKIGFIKGLAKSVSLNHAYTSSYSEGWKIDPDGKKQVQTQRINYGFSPLIGLNITFDKLWDGNLSGSFKYSTKNSFDLGIATRNITESFSRDINFTASFSKSGFSLPMFGLDLKNDIEISLSYTSAQNSVLIYEMENFNEKGKPQDGTTRTIIEPRVKYTLSSKVTLSVFFKRTTVEPEGASRIPPTTTNEAGLDVHISIQ